MKRQQLFDQVQAQGRRRFARWDDAYFARIHESYGATLWRGLQSKACAEAFYKAYLELVAEMLGEGYIQPVEDLDALHEQHLLATIFFLLVPRTIESWDESKAMGWCVDLWNVGEGLLGEPPWLQRLVMAHAHQLCHPELLDPFLLEVLEPALAPTDEAQWMGPFSSSRHDTRAIHRSFLPGALHLVAPSVLCIHDAREESHIGMFLHKGGNSAFVGLMDCLGAPLEAQAPPQLDFAEDRVAINGTAVELVNLGRCSHHALSDAGFLALSVQNSQRIWIVESP